MKTQNRAIWLAVLALAVVASIAAPMAATARYTASAGGTGPIAVAKWAPGLDVDNWDGAEAVSAVTFLLRRDGADLFINPNGNASPQPTAEITLDNLGSDVRAAFAFVHAATPPACLMYIGGTTAASHQVGQGLDDDGVPLYAAIRKDYKSGSLYEAITLDIDWTATQVD